MATRTDAVLDERLREFGLHLHSERENAQWEDGVPERATLRRGGVGHSVLVLPVADMAFTTTAPSLPRDSATPLLLVGPRVSERSADTYRRRGINYLDSAGNAYIDLEGILIDVRGRRPPMGVGSRRPAGSTNLFSTKRAQVIFALLSWPELVNAPVRPLARAAGVSVGQAQETQELLRQRGYLDPPGAPRIRKGAELLDNWLAAYPTGLGSPARQRTFAGDITQVRPIADREVFVSGEYAVPDLLRPETLTVYVDDFDPSLVIANRWRTDREPNIIVRDVFWRDPGGGRAPGTVHPAPRLLIIADLEASGDSQQNEAALQLRRSDDRFRSV